MGLEKPIQIAKQLNRLKIVADEKIPFLKGVLEPFAEVVYLPGNLISRDSVRDADALLIRTRTLCDKALLDGTAVKFIATATIGFDHIDAEYCRANNIEWVNAPGCNSSSVQQYIVAALLTIAEKNAFNLSEKTLGIIGAGNVGSKVQAAARILGMKVKLNDPPRARSEGSAGFVTLNEILETCDIITLHVPLNRDGADKTFHLFDKELIPEMKRGAWLINSSRGEVVETSALKQALSSGKIGGAVLDVWENEPNIDLELLSKVFISTPHIAGYSTDGKANGTSQIVQSLSGFFGLPLTAFYPQGLPLPFVPEIIISGMGKPTNHIVRQAVLHTYPVTEDHRRLQNSPGTFEQQRGQYPIRREFPAYTVKVLNGATEATEILEMLGFQIDKT
jgi:erythronate-4-phosphate dehydrogenase